MLQEMLANTIGRNPGWKLTHEMGPPSLQEYANAKTSRAGANDDHGMMLGRGH
jgi:hypothetical protein